ncbi:MAG: FAD-dependent monooxygenase [Cyanobacteriota bacterium]|nr:FAD-dependent monooxygenase [Cyanobacteriota bacterium]
MSDQKRPGRGPQVVVVGAGPCGAALALGLARAGWAVTLVEQLAPGLARPYRGEGLMPSGVEALEALALWPLPARVRHRPLAGWAVVLERQPFFTVAEPLAEDRGCWLVDQASLLSQLRAELEGGSGGRVLEGQAVRGLLRAAGVGRANADGGRKRRMAVDGRRERPRAEPAPGRVAGVVLADGTELRADLVVACDGRNSMLRRLAGLGLEEEGAGRLTGEGPPLDPKERGDPREGQELEGRPQGEGAGDRRGRDRQSARWAEREGEREPVWWFRLAGAAVAPLERWLAGRFLTVVGAGVSFALFAEAGGETLRLGWVAEAGVALPADGAGWREGWAAALPEEAAALVRDLPLAAIEGPQRFPVRVGWAPRWHVPGLLLLGDAAHPMRPVRAQGINMALRDALLAARLLGPLGGRPPVEAAPGPRPPEALGATHASIDALLPTVAARRLQEILPLQAAQAREAGLGARLRQLGWLRRGLAATAPWSGPLARRRWIQRQHRLRQGLPGALSLPE